MTSTLHMLAVSALVLMAMTAPAAAQTDRPDAHTGRASHGHNADHGTGIASDRGDVPVKGTLNEASRAFVEANARMHASMDITFSGDADVDFVKGMIAHHQGAVDMARIVLEHGKDPEIRELAREIIKAQESEISMMQDWLRIRGR